MAKLKTPELFRCAVSFGGIADLRDFLLEKREFGGYQTLWERQLGWYWSDRSKLEETSPVNYADQIRTPLLLIHGAEDRWKRLASKIFATWSFRSAMIA